MGIRLNREGCGNMEEVRGKGRVNLRRGSLYSYVILRFNLRNNYEY